MGTREERLGCNASHGVNGTDRKEALTLGSEGAPDGRLAVAMSGGVDSSVAAALLLEAGRDVFGVTMRLGLAEIAGRPCCGEEEARLARRVCDRLGIQHVVIDLAADFEAAVVAPFCDAYASGLTPNPCVWCNEHVKLGSLAGRVRSMGATRLATGHYARVVRDAEGVWLERGVDTRKDQSYFLYRVSPAVLDMLEFPLGDLTKAEVRTMAAERGLPSAKRPESQEVCFTDDHTRLVAERHPEAFRPGPIVNEGGTVLGTHRGIARYTVGQRKGLGLGGHRGSYRVIRIDAARNTVVVEPASAPATRSAVGLTDPLWRLEGAARVLAQVRYRSTPVRALAQPEDDGLTVIFDSPVAPLAPGQSVVLYRGPRVVGGGFVPAQG